MLLSFKANYAIHAIMYLAAVNRRRFCKIDEISESINAPQNYLVKILIQLTYQGLIESRKSKDGGYRLSKPPGEISFLEIIETIDGPIILASCNGSGSKKPKMHRKGKCGASLFFAELNKKVVRELSNMTFGKLVYEKYRL